MENVNQIRLLQGMSCGTNSKDIYAKYAEMFGWDISQRFQFGTQGQPLYARDATREGYSVWCIAHSNLNGTKGGRWSNKISCDRSMIEEFWETRTYDYLHDFFDTTLRIVFAKSKEGQYKFFGVYKPDSPSGEQKTVEWFGAYGYLKIYRRISECYPLKND